jgi:ankyrin repeat protein
LVLFSGCEKPERALVRAAGNGDLESITKLCGRRLDPDLIIDGYTAMTLALDKGHPECVPLLLKCHANPNKPNERFHSPLQLACFSGYLVAATQLLDAGADINEVNSASPPLLLAILGDQPDILQLLIARHVNLSVRWAGKTPVMAALMNKKFDLIPILDKAHAP